MNDASTWRVAAVFSFLSPLAILAGVPFAAGLGGVGAAARSARHDRRSRQRRMTPSRVGVVFAPRPPHA
jgi:hypothetical protein